MNAWSECRCNGRRHATYRGWARCKLRHARWITGDGPYALISWCAAPTVTLWQTHTQALDAQNLLYAIRCGSQCRGRHEVIYLQLDRKATTWQ